VAIARTSDPNSGSGEFFIQLKDNSAWLGPGGSDKYGYTVFMKIVEGWDTIDKIMSQGKKDGRIVIARAIFV